MKSKRRNYFLRRALALLITCTMSIGLLQTTALAEGEDVLESAGNSEAQIPVEPGTTEETNSVTIEVNGVAVATGTQTVTTTVDENGGVTRDTQLTVDSPREEEPAEPAREVTTETVDKTLEDGTVVSADKTVTTETDAEGNTTTSTTTEWTVNDERTETTENGSSTTTNTTTTEKEWETERKDESGSIIETGSGASGSSETTTTTRGEETTEKTEGAFQKDPDSVVETGSTTPTPAPDVTTEVKDPVSVDVTTGETKTEMYQPVISDPPEAGTFTETDETGAEVKKVVAHQTDENGNVIGVTITTTKVVDSVETTTVEEVKGAETNKETIPPLKPEPKENQTVTDVLDADGNIIGYTITTTETDGEGNRKVESQTVYATNKTQQTVTTTTTTSTKHQVEGTTETTVKEQGSITAGLTEVTHAEGSDLPKVTGATVTLKSGNSEDGYNVDVVLKLSAKPTADGMKLTVCYGGQSYEVNLSDISDDGCYTLTGLNLRGNEDFKLQLTGTQVKQIADNTAAQEEVLRNHLQAEGNVWKDIFNDGGGTSLGDAGNFAVFAKEYTNGNHMEGNIAVGTLHATDQYIGANGKVMTILGLNGSATSQPLDYSSKIVSYIGTIDGSEVKLDSTGNTNVQASIVVGSQYSSEKGSQHYTLTTEVGTEVQLTDAASKIEGVYTAEQDIDFDAALNNLAIYADTLAALKPQVQIEVDSFDKVKKAQEEAQGATQALQTALQEIVTNPDKATEAISVSGDATNPNWVIDCSKLEAGEVNGDKTYIISISILEFQKGGDKIDITGVTDAKVLINITGLDNDYYKLDKHIGLNGEYSQWNADNGKVMLNFGQYAGDLEFVKTDIGSILAPKASVLINQTHDGNIIANSVKNQNGEIHRAPSWEGPGKKPPTTTTITMQVELTIKVDDPSAQTKTQDSTWNESKTDVLVTTREDEISKTTSNWWYSTTEKPDAPEDPKTPPETPVDPPDDPPPPGPDPDPGPGPTPDPEDPYTPPPVTEDPDGPGETPETPAPPETETFDDEPTPLADTPVNGPLTDLPDSQPPVLAEFIDEEVPLEEFLDEEVPLEEFPDEEIPLVDVPRTGDMSAVWYAVTLLAACGLLVLCAIRRRANG